MNKVSLLKNNTRYFKGKRDAESQSKERSQEKKGGKRWV